jgi:predicted transcriptional regulator
MRKHRFLLWGFKPPSDLVQAGLGSLEQQVIDIVWGAREVTVRDVYLTLEEKIAYTTVMTTLDRLFRKGLLDRIKRSRAFVYSAAASRDEFDEIVASEVVSGLLSGAWTAPRPFLSNLVDTVGERDRALFEELERLVKTKRRQIRRREEP